MEKNKKKNPKKWIQGAIKKKGSLRATAKRKGGLSKSGDITDKFLSAAEGGKYGAKTKKRAILAKTLKSFHKK